MVEGEVRIGMVVKEGYGPVLEGREVIQPFSEGEDSEIEIEKGEEKVSREYEIG